MTPEFSYRSALPQVHEPSLIKGARQVVLHITLNIFQLPWPKKTLLDLPKPNPDLINAAVDW